MFDADIHIDILDSALAEGGRNCIVLCDALLPPLKMGKTLKLITVYESNFHYLHSISFVVTSRAPGANSTRSGCKISTNKTLP